VTARRQFGAVIVACVAGVGLMLLALRQGWARVDYTAPKPLPSGSIPVSGQDLLPAAGALALAALACLAAVIATRGVARRVVGVVMAGLGVWIAVLVSEPVSEATVLAAASGQAAGGGFAGSVPGGNSAISGGVPSGGGLPAIGQASRVVLAAGPWRAAALLGAVAVIAAGLTAAWLGPRWAVMSARFDQPARPGRPEAGPAARASAAVPAAGAAAPASPPVSGPGAAVPASPPGPAAGAASGASRAAASGSRAAGPASRVPAGASRAADPASQAAAGGSQAPAGASQAVPAAGPGAPAAGARPADQPGPADPGRAETRTRASRPDDDAAALWEALDRGVDLTDTGDGGAEPAAAPAQAEES
jgi:Tryptophan-associated transmembrane protein (Trp_oprn_chp)